MQYAIRQKIKTLCRTNNASGAAIGSMLLSASAHHLLICAVESLCCRSAAGSVTGCVRVTAPFPRALYLFLINHGMLFAYERPLCANNGQSRTDKVSAESLS